MAVDAESVGQGEGDLAARIARRGDCRFHRRARLGRVPQIALEVEDRGVGNIARVDIARLQPLRRTKERVHRPLRIGSDQDQRARGGADIAARGDEEIDPEALDVVAIDVAQLVARHLADEAGLEPERGKSRRRIAGRSAADLAPRPHYAVKAHRLGFVDQSHRPFVQPLFGKEGIVGIGDHIDDGISDAQHIEAGSSHLGVQSLEMRDFGGG